MTMQNMFGVVLWSDTVARKAVIWCEDQGDLAFYTPGANSALEAPSLDAGDLIQFDMIIQENMRRASNPQLLMSHHAPDLPESLRDKAEAPAAPRRSASTGTVIDLSKYLEPAAVAPRIAMSV